MSQLRCLTCGTLWDAAAVPTCPVCQASRWLQSPSLISEKHDPTLLPKIWKTFRSVVSYQVAASPSAYLQVAAASGSWYYERSHSKWFTVSASPLGPVAGSPIRKGNSMPHGAFDTLVIADSSGAAHIYAQDYSELVSQIHAGTAIPLARCAVNGCDNLAVPSRLECAMHSGPPTAQGMAS